MIPVSLNNNYAQLGTKFSIKTSPSSFSKPSLIKLNESLCDDFNLPFNQLNSDVGADYFSGRRLFDGSEPTAMAYAGHQFGHFNQQLGDGRALLLGELESGANGFYDLQLKGSGKTFFSRGGDGLAALGPAIREYLVSEAMFKLGVPTTRALAVASTGDDVMRDSILPGGIITRVAKSFVRVGTFQYFAARGDKASIKKLADYVIQQDFKDVLDKENTYIELFEKIVTRQAKLIAKWMQFGFIHGVMNTDNMSVVGETIDYGPCAFMDHFSHDKVFSSIDRDGRYAYRNQASIGLWNLTRLAETLLPLFDDDDDIAIDKAKQILESFITIYEDNWLAGMRAKCGLRQSADSLNQEDDRSLIETLFNLMDDNGADFTLVFYYLSRLPNERDSEWQGKLQTLFQNSNDFEQWLDSWYKRVVVDKQTELERHTLMQSVNPVYIPRNHQIEAAIRAAEDNCDFSLFHDLLEVLENPFNWQEGQEDYFLPPTVSQVVHKTFCGT